MGSGKSWAWLALSAAVTVSTPAWSADASATLHRITDDGRTEAVGTVTFSDSADGLMITPALHGLENAGPHGAHIHENASCAAATVDGEEIAGKTAGGHYDPDNTGRHAGPYGSGHLGDLPNLIAESDGAATIPVLAPRLAVSDLQGRAIMIHARVDRYDDHSDHSHGKGGVRRYCGVIE